MIIAHHVAFIYYLLKILYRKMPRLTLTEGFFEFLGQDTLFLQMNIAFHITVATADRALVSMLCRRIEITLVQKILSLWLI